MTPIFFVPDRGPSSEATLKHHLIIALAVICVIIVGVVIILILRRPNFCKKQSGRNVSSNHLRGVVVEDNPGMMTSGGGGDLNSLPVAMNTGIFVPGGSYDWQETRFQENTLTGTSVF